MTWNYRVVKRPVGTPQSLGGVQHFTYGIHEAYYNDNGSVWGITTDAISLSADHLNELKIDWDMLVEAFGKPVLNYDEVCGENAADPPFDVPDEEEDCEETDDDFVAELDLEPFDSDGYDRELAEQNEKEELQHTEEFIGRSPEHIHSLIKTLRSQSP